MGSRLWEIRESYGDRMGYRMGEKTRDWNAAELEAYECGRKEGYEEGYEDAQSEMAGERIGRREHYMGERRRRDSMGRFR